MIIGLLDLVLGIHVFEHITDFVDAPGGDGLPAKKLGQGSG